MMVMFVYNTSLENACQCTLSVPVNAFFFLFLVSCKDDMLENTFVSTSFAVCICMQLLCSDIQIADWNLYANSITHIMLLDVCHMFLRINISLIKPAAAEHIFIGYGSAMAVQLTPWADLP